MALLFVPSKEQSFNLETIKRLNSCVWSNDIRNLRLVMTELALTQDTCHKVTSILSSHSLPGGVAGLSRYEAVYTQVLKAYMYSVKS